MTQAQHISTVCGKKSSLANFDLWTIVGEWTPGLVLLTFPERSAHRMKLEAMTDCAKYLNGRGVGARYDGTRSGSPKVGSCTGLSGAASTFSSSYKTFLRKFWEAQTSSYEAGAGWVQWTWKTESGTGEEWSYSAGLKYGWIPQNPTQRQYPNICSS